MEIFALHIFFPRLALVYYKFVIADLWMDYGGLFRSKK